MEIINKVIEWRVTSDSLDVFTSQFVNINGVDVKLDGPVHVVPYYNKTSDRNRLMNDYPEKASSIFQIWGEPKDE